MARRCAVSGKGVMFGHRVSHSNKKTSRKFKPNLHKATVRINGKKRRVKLATKWLRKMKLEAS